MRVAVLTSLAILVLAGGVAAGEHLTLDQAKAEAARTHKPVLVDFYATWCGPCKAFAAAAESDDTIKKALDGVVLCKLDAEKEGLDLAKQMLVKGYPTFVLLDDKGATTARWWGFGKDEFPSRLAEAAADPTSIDAKTARFAKSPTVKDALTLASYHETRNESVDAVKYLDRAMEMDPSQDLAGRKFETVSAGFTRANLFDMKTVADAADAVEKSKSSTPWDLISVANTMRELAQKNKTPEMIGTYLVPALAVTANATDPDLQKQHQLLKVDQALYVDHDKDRAVTLKRQTMAEGWKEDSKQLNGFAWWCFENEVNLEEAEALARHGAELAPAGSERAMVLDTAAEICNARKNCDDAVELEKQAMKESPSSEFYKKQLERFTELRAARTN